MLLGMDGLCFTSIWYFNLKSMGGAKVEAVLANESACKFSVRGMKWIFIDEKKFSIRSQAQFLYSLNLGCLAWYCRFICLTINSVSPYTSRFFMLVSWQLPILKLKLHTHIHC
jgi:hypothetical protein